MATRAYVDSLKRFAESQHPVGLPLPFLRPQVIYHLTVGSIFLVRSRMRRIIPVIASQIAREIGDLAELIAIGLRQRRGS
jgi:hypothetical protein